jgi:hypothetical protein
LTVDLPAARAETALATNSLLILLDLTILTPPFCFVGRARPCPLWAQRTQQIGDVFITSSRLSLSSGKKPLPPHVGHRRSSSVPFSTTPVAVWTGFHVRLMRMLPHPSNGRATMGGMMQMAVSFAGVSLIWR